MPFPLDILMQIIPHCDTVQAMSDLSRTCKFIHNFMMHSDIGRRLWLDLARKITGYKAHEHITSACPDFHYKLKLLFCPWLSLPRTLDIKVGTGMETDNMHITLNKKEDRVVLWSKTDEFEMINSGRARPDDDEEPALESIPTTPPRLSIFRKTFFPVFSTRELEIMPNQGEFRFFHQTIHKGAFAVIEIASWDLEERSGIYIFSRDRSRKMLRHILIGEFPAKTSMIIRPMEMWMLTEERVIYFGPTCDPRPLAIEGRMDKALWLAAAGKVSKAKHYLETLGVNDINTPTITGNMTLLHAATFKNRLAAVRFLLEEKADPEARDDQDMTCLMIASSMEYYTMIRVLCKHGQAEPNVETTFNESALHLVGSNCVKNKRTKSTVEALLKCKADPNAEDIRGQTPLFRHAILESPSTVELMCSRGANPLHRNHNAETPLHALFKACNQRETATLLVKKFNVDVNAQDSNGMTALMYAAGSRQFVNVRMLLDELKANPLLRNIDGDSALDLAQSGYDAPAQARAVIRMLEFKCEEWRRSH